MWTRSRRMRGGMIPFRLSKWLGSPRRIGRAGHLTSPNKGVRDGQFDITRSELHVYAEGARFHLEPLGGFSCATSRGRTGDAHLPDAALRSPELSHLPSSRESGPSDTESDDGSQYLTIRPRWYTGGY